MSLSELIKIPATCTVFLAPPAWGKTTLLLDLPGPWIFVSPLRALAEEFAERVKVSGERVRILRSRSDEDWVNFCRNPRGVLVATPETLPGRLPANIQKKCFMVLDEFHLFLHWGETFRPLLREQLYAWANQKIPILGLSATLEESQMAELKQWQDFGFDHITIIDQGNMQFKNPPTWQSHYGQNFAALRRRLVWESVKADNSGIVFCKTRAQVKHWSEWFARRGLNCLACVGGEVESFRQKLATSERVQWIITTSALSHGVNLPSFKHVFIAYKPESNSLWLQMAARGGRRGESFHLHSMQKGSLKSQIKLCLFDMLIKFKLYWHL